MPARSMDTYHFVRIDANEDGTFDLPRSAIVVGGGPSRIDVLVEEAFVDAFDEEDE